MNFSRSYKGLVLLSIFLIISNLAFSQGEKKFITFSGYVIDGKTQEPLPGAYIMLPKAGKAVIANSSGFFTISAFPGDSVVFSYLSYKKQYHIIPKNVELSYSAAIALQTDAKMLKEVKVYPYRTEQEFKEALIAMKIPDEREREVLAQTFNPETIRSMGFSIGMGAASNYRYAMDLQQKSFTNQGTVTMNPLFNPFAWASFISGLKKGSMKDKSWKNAANNGPIENVTRDEFFRNGGVPERH